MRYWLLVALLNGLFTLVIHYAAPEMFGSTAYYAGVAICALIALVITWRDPPGMLDNVLLFLLKWGIVASGLAFFIWGIRYYRMRDYSNLDHAEILARVKEGVQRQK